MIRKLLLPALAVAMLAGCATYQYRGGAGGDYYYGRPGTDYRYYGYGGYGYGGYGYGYPHWGGSIGYGYYRSSPWYYYPRYPHYPHHSGGGHHHGGSNGGGDHDGDHDGGDANPAPRPPDRPRPPWRDLGSIGERPHIEAKRPMPAAEREVSSPIRTVSPRRVRADRQPLPKRKRDGHPVSIP